MATNLPPDSENYRRDVAGRFFQTTATKTFNLYNRWFPDQGAWIEEQTRRIVEEEGLLEEVVGVVLNWCGSDADAAWLEAFANSPEGSRFLDLTIEIYARANARQHHPELQIPPVGDS